MSDHGRGHSSEPSDRIKLIVNVPGSRLKALIEHGLGHLVGTAVLGFITGLISAAISVTELISKVKIWLGQHPTKTGAIDIFITSAYAAAEPLSGPAFSGILKSTILAGIFVSLFVFFIWALVTLSRSRNAKAVDVAAEAIKTLAGFFIGALTGFLGA